MIWYFCMLYNAQDISVSQYRLLCNILMQIALLSFLCYRFFLSNIVAFHFINSVCYELLIHGNNESYFIDKIYFKVIFSMTLFVK